MCREALFRTHGVHMDLHRPTEWLKLKGVVVGRSYLHASRENERFATSVLFFRKDDRRRMTSLTRESHRWNSCRSGSIFRWYALTEPERECAERKCVRRRVKDASVLSLARGTPHHLSDRGLNISSEATSTIQLYDCSTHMVAPQLGSSTT